MLIVTETNGSRTGAAYVAEQSRGLEAHLVSASWYRNILAALVDERGRHLALGILQSVDFERQQLEMIAPELRPERIRQVILGSIRVSGHGREIGRVQPSILSASARSRR